MFTCAASSIHPNTLNLPVCDLHDKEARDQILLNFHTLASATATISERQSSKCQEQSDRIKALGDRIARCKAQMNHLEGLNQAICFVSPSQYPKKYHFELDSHQSHLDDFLHHTRPTHFDYSAPYLAKHDPKELGNASKLKIKDLDECANYILNELKKAPKSVIEKARRSKEAANYGKIPQNIRYLDSLSVFDSNINPYRRFSNDGTAKKPTIHSKISQQQLEKVNISSMLQFKLSRFNKENNVAKEQRYVPQNQWEEILFDENLDLDNLVNLQEKTAQKEEFNFTRSNQVPKQKPVSQPERRAPAQQIEKKDANEVKKDESSPVVLPNILETERAVTKDNHSTFHLFKQIDPIKVEASPIQPIPILEIPKLNLPLPPPPNILEIPKLNLPLPPPPNILEIPKLNLPLPPPPPTILEIPKLNLPLPPPPPPISLPPLSLPPPTLSPPPLLPAALPVLPQANNFLSEIQNYSKDKLKPTITNQQKEAKESTERDGAHEPKKERDKQQSEDGDDLISALKIRLIRRKHLLNRNQEEESS